MATASQRWTADMLRSLPDDGNRYEVIDGELFVTPSPTAPHQRAIAALLFRLAPYAKQHRIAEVLFSPAEFRYGPETAVQPDMFAMALVRGERPKSWADATLILAVEVLSPSSARSDREVKRRLYRRQNVAEYWIVDVDARVIERWRADDERPEILSDRIEWQPSSGAPVLAVDLREYFAEVRGE